MISTMSWNPVLCSRFPFSENEKKTCWYRYYRENKMDVALYSQNCFFFFFLRQQNEINERGSKHTPLMRTMMLFFHKACGSLLRYVLKYQSANVWIFARKSVRVTLRKFQQNDRMVFLARLLHISILEGRGFAALKGYTLCSWYILT